MSTTVYSADSLRITKSDNKDDDRPKRKRWEFSHTNFPPDSLDKPESHQEAGRKRRKAIVGAQETENEAEKRLERVKELGKELEKELEKLEKLIKESQKELEKVLEKDEAFKHLIPTPSALESINFRERHLAGAFSGLFEEGTNTQCSEAEMTSATQQLVNVLCDDEFLKLLYKEAIESEAIGTERFCRVFRRLLRIYAKELKEEAVDDFQYSVARLIQLKAWLVAELIKKRYTAGKAPPTDALPPVNPQFSQVKPATEDSSDEEQPGNIQEDNVKIISAVTSFLKNGVAFENLKTSFEKFVSPVQRWQPIVKPGEGDESMQPTAVHHSKGRDRTIMQFLARLGFIERPLDPNKQRVRWKCVSDKSGC